MKTLNKAAILLLSTILMGVSQFAVADDCGIEIDAVRTVLNDWGDPDGFCADPEELHKNGVRICDSLNSKLDGADDKIAAGKFVRSVQKIAQAPVPTRKVEMRTPAVAMVAMAKTRWRRSPR